MKSLSQCNRVVKCADVNQSKALFQNKLTSCENGVKVGNVADFLVVFVHYCLCRSKGQRTSSCADGGQMDGHVGRGMAGEIVSGY